jgi:hypothetical protein
MRSGGRGRRSGLGGVTVSLRVDGRLSGRDRLGGVGEPGWITVTLTPVSLA